METFSNYQIEVQLEEGPKQTKVVTITLSGELAESIGWKKRIFICRTKNDLIGRSLKPLHQTPDNIEIYERNSTLNIFEISLNHSKIRLFRHRPQSRITKWLKKF
jgi:hypothetical protein